VKNVAMKKPRSKIRQKNNLDFISETNKIINLIKNDFDVSREITVLSGVSKMTISIHRKLSIPRNTPQLLFDRTALSS